MFELSYAICPYAHFHKQATNCFSNVNKNTMISGLWVPLKALLAHKIWNMFLKPRGSSRAVCVHASSYPWQKTSDQRAWSWPRHFTHTACLLPRYMGAAGPCHCLMSPVSLAVLEEPRLVLSLAFPMCSQVWSRGVPAHFSLFSMSRDSSSLKL